MVDLHVVTVNQQDRRLGRQMVHDPRSRAFPAALRVDKSTWRSRSVALYDPYPNPNQTIGNCTGCQKAMAFNAIGNRQRVGRRWVIHNMDWATKCYELATSLDPWEGSYPPDDTGSSGLAACKAAQQMGVGGEYRWMFGGVDEVVQAIMVGQTVGIGTWWYADMFTPVYGSGLQPRIEPTGARVGGHQYTARGYDKTRDLVQIRCWWGAYRDVWIRREHLGDLLADGGDANTQSVA